jgi:hypothetical protein
VKVTHSHVVAHQIFALRLISWLEGVLGHSEGFRALFSRILVEQEVGPTGRKQPSILEGKSLLVGRHLPHIFLLFISYCNNHIFSPGNTGHDIHRVERSSNYMGKTFCHNLLQSLNVP